MRVGKFSLLALALLATPAMAAERPGFYIGGDVGQSNWNLSEADANDLTDALAGTIGGLANATIVDTSTDFSDTDTTYSLFVGYQIVPWLAVEAAWMDLGNMNVESAGTYSFTTVNPPPANVATGGSYSSRTEFQSSGPAVSALLMLPFMEAWNVYGRLGYYMGDNELIGNYDAQNVRLGTPIGAPYAADFTQSDDSGVFLWGAGVSYTWNQRVSMRLEYTNITDVVEIDADNASDMERFTLGVAYRFGHVEEPMAPMAAPVAAAPAAVAATKCADADNDGVCDQDDRCANTPAGDRVGPRGCSCDVTIRTHFAFDSAELTAEDKAELERVAARLKELEFVGGTATGHTDSVGDEAYNQKLSERRAQAVVDFLYAQGVAVGRITASGMGEVKPIADNATEEGRAQNRRVTIRRTDCGPAN
jgi:outer membrane protein OmpA-like peptidoglycan-associated protein/opacity protein-like surface antigen